MWTKRAFNSVELMVKKNNELRSICHLSFLIKINNFFISFIFVFFFCYIRYHNSKRYLQIPFEILNSNSMHTTEESSNKLLKFIYWKQGAKQIKMWTKLYRNCVVWLRIKKRKLLSFQDIKITAEWAEKMIWIIEMSLRCIYSIGYLIFKWEVVALNAIIFMKTTKRTVEFFLFILKKIFSKEIVPTRIQ